MNKVIRVRIIQSMQAWETETTSAELVREHWDESDWKDETANASETTQKRAQSDKWENVARYRKAMWPGIQSLRDWYNSSFEAKFLSSNKQKKQVKELETSHRGNWFLCDRRLSEWINRTNIRNLPEREWWLKPSLLKPAGIEKQWIIANNTGALPEELT